MQPSTQGAKARISRARTHLILDEPFFGNLIYRLKFVEDYSADTAWVDGVHLGYNPNYIETISDEELKGLLCHEILHVACGHCWRRKWRDPEKWNAAADYAINLIVLTAGYNLPPNGLVNAEYKGKPAEIIYDLLPDPPPGGTPEQSAKAEGSQGNSSDDDGSSEDSSSDSTQSAEDGKQGAEGAKSPDKDKASSQAGADGSEKSDESSQGKADESGSSGQSSQDADGAEENEGSGRGQDKGQKRSKESSQDTKEAKGQNSKGKKEDKSSEASPDETPRPMETSDKPFGQRVPGEVRDAPTSVDTNVLEAEWKIAVQEALTCATRRGKVPGGAKELAGEALKPRVDWRAVLRLFIQQAWVAVDYTWRAPAANYIPYGLYMPRLASESLPCIVIGFDTSGSVSNRLLAQFKAEVRSIVEELCPEECYLMYCDSMVQSVLRFVAHEPVVFAEIPGRGGTNFIPVFQRVEAEQLSPVCLIYLTDMDGVAPATPPDYPVLWVSPPTSIAAPWGEHVQMYD